MNVLLVDSLDRSHYNFRLPLANALRDMGANVALVCPDGQYTRRLQDAGFRVIHWPLHRQSLNPILEAVAIARLRQIYQREHPDIVHHFTIKPNVYGSIAARLCGIPHIVNTWTGLGFVFSESFRARQIRRLLVPLLGRLSHSRNLWTVFHNEDNLRAFVRLRIIDPDRAIVIPGSGVDLDRFKPEHYPDSDPPVALMASRLIRDKGVGEFVEAGRILRQRGVQARFWVAGSPDKGNPTCVTEDDLQRWQKEGVVEFLGQQEDMPELLHRSAIGVLPSYNEGVPRFLLEAAACGLPIVATDISGCRMVAQENVNGFLVPIKDSIALAEAINKLLQDPQLRARMGKASREIAVQEFDERRVVQQYLNLYRQMGAIR